MSVARTSLFLTLALAVSVVIGFRTDSFTVPPEFEVPEGFAVEEVYIPGEDGSPVSLTFDSFGRLVLAMEDTFVVTLYPTADGGYEERVFSEDVWDSQGIFFEGNDLIVVSNGKEGVGMYRIYDDDGDSRGDRTELMERVLGRIGDHGPHAPFFGPDGHLYWTIGNAAHFYSSPAPLSPFKNYSEGVLEMDRFDARGHATSYRSPGGTFSRKDLADPDAEWERIAGGFRNQYDGAFNLMGELFTFDSDLEFDRDLPWYRPVRTIHVVPGGDYGWRTGSTKHPPYYLDTLPMTEDLGRGSPTGLIAYQGYNYPEEYWDMVLQADWSRGRLVMGMLTKDGATYSQKSGNFVFATPLNISDVEVGPDGNVYFTLGGRGTEGGVYRVVYTGLDAMGQPDANTPLDRVLTMMQPRSAFSRKLARDTKAEIGDEVWQQGLTAVVRDVQASPERRVRALELLHVYGPGLDDNTLVPLGKDASWEVRAASTFYLGTRTGRGARNAQRELVNRLKDSDPFVQRRAAEALIRTGIHPAMDAPFSAQDDIMPLLGSPDRFVRYAAREVLRRTNRNDWQEAALTVEGYPAAPEALLAYALTIDGPSVKDVRFLLTRQLQLLRANPNDQDLLNLTRVIQRTMLEDHGVPFEGGRRDTVALYPSIGEILLDRFPAADTSLNREIVRALAYLETPGAVSKVAAELNNPDIPRTQQIAYAHALAYMETGWDDVAIEDMAQFLERAYGEKWRGGASFVGHLNFMEADFLSYIPDEDRRASVAERLNALKPQLAAIPTGGGPGNRRPPSLLSDEEIAENLMFRPERFEEPPDLGAWAYEKALCGTCHTFGPLGVEYGPDLTTVNQRFNRVDLVREVMFPSEIISDLWQAETIIRRSGEVVMGMLASENVQSVVLQIPGGPQVSVPKSDIESRVQSEVSAMPGGLLSNLSNDEQASLFALLEAGPEAIPDSVLERIQVLWPAER